MNETKDIASIADGAEIAGPFDYENYLKALRLISMMALVHRHEPIFSPDDEAIANELGMEHLRLERSRDGIQVPRPLVCQQQDTISDLRTKCGDLQREVSMLRSYEGEWAHLLRTSESETIFEREEKEQALKMLRSTANRLGHEDFGEICRSIDKYTDEATSRQKAHQISNDQPMDVDEEGMKVATFKTIEKT